MSRGSVLRIAGVLGVVVCTTGVLAGAHGMHDGVWGGGMGLEPNPGMMFPMILRSVGMSAEQQTKVQGIMDAHRPRFQELLGQLRAAHEDVMARLLGPGPLTANDLKAPVQRVATLLRRLRLVRRPAEAAARDVAGRDEEAARGSVGPASGRLSLRPGAGRRAGNDPCGRFCRSRVTRLR